jgi:hypothetical protein
MRVFISAYVNGKDCGHTELGQKLSKIGVTKEVKGCFNGIEELSYMIETDNVNRIERLAFKTYEQKCILIVDNGKATLKTVSGKVYDLGRFIQIAHKPNGCDFSCIDDKYYVVAKNDYWTKRGIK